MSTLKVTNVAGLTGSSTNLEQGLAKTWINFDGSATGTVRDSFNHSSIDDNGVGRYDLHATNAFSNDDYVPQVTIGFVSDTGRYGEVTNFRSTSEVEVGARNSGGSSVDNDGVHVAIFGDLA